MSASVVYTSRLRVLSHQYWYRRRRVLGLSRNNDEYRHTAWQPLVKSFNVAFKAGLPASGMRPVNGDDITGALWHRAFLKSSLCASDPWGKPNNSGWAKDTINWAVVMPDNISGARVQVYSGGNQISRAPPARSQLRQRREHGCRPPLYSKTSHVAVTANPKDNICHYNYVVGILLKGGPN
ncbi:glycoside hydrolase [Apiospora arundinis]